MQNENKKKVITENRPWGSYTLFALNQECTVKILHVNGKLSTQSHKNREELWYLVAGKVKVYKGAIRATKEETEANLECVVLNPGEDIVIPKETAHTIENLAREGSYVLEVSYGHFDENDEVRYKDIYGRE